MKKGLIVYNKIDEKKNEWFINRCLNELNDESFSLFYKEEDEVIPFLENNKIDFVIYRARDYSLVKRMEKLGIRVFNNSLTNMLANDKFETFLFCKRNDIPCLETYKNSGDVNEYPLITKTVNGHGGQEVFLLNDKEDETSFKKDETKTYIYQKYVKNVKDVRLYVLNNHVIGAVKRENDKDYRSNFSLGGQVSSYVPTKEMIDIATKISKAIEADYIGVDFFILDNSVVVNEIEDPVGARMLYATTGIDIISLFIQDIKNKLNN